MFVKVFVRRRGKSELHQRPSQRQHSINFDKNGLELGKVHATVSVQFVQPPVEDVAVGRQDHHKLQQPS